MVFPLSAEIGEGQAVKFLGYIFGTIGAVMLAFTATVHFYQQAAFADAMSAQGTVIGYGQRSSSGSASRVQFRNINGQYHRFESNVSSSPPRYAVGDPVTVKYQPDKPSSAAIDDFLGNYLFVLIFGGIGFVFFAIGAGILIAVFGRKRTIAKLLKRGLPIQAKYIETYRDTSVKVNGRSPYRVVAQATHPATGKLQQFKSEMLWIDPSEQMEGQSVRVLVNPNKPKQHYVDLSEFIGAD
ncbi:DUF3592 domain-containing protein [Altererythrobacter sp. RZ02]|uniref:DUF3592 domain-containing protein n=1 Tax=Pontixanthobacter rizhaonensis TaxID=2730337 RepID=A0A848QTT3_9SPHN|nr:DUF3592 domain-containing protein [Pontixanthobacter rizhaonensis]NMW32866.1 DUF3592 domain-containing protein [Pontixanthobacter rizhaonensis]